MTGIDPFEIKLKDNPSLVELIMEKELSFLSSSQLKTVKTSLNQFPLTSRKIYALLEGYYGERIGLQKIADVYNTTHREIIKRYWQVAKYINKMKR